MGFFNTYPYTDFHELNLDWVLKRLQEFETEVENISESILNDAKKYTDEQLSGYQAQLDSLSESLAYTVETLNIQNEQFKTEVRAQITLMQQRIRELKAEIDADIIGVNARTDEAIRQNNEYILSELGKELGKIKVVNYFTGLLVSVQEMFDYLARLHADDAITVNELIDKAKTYDELIAYNMTYTQLAQSGKTIIV